jgi:hypothetical protein
MPNPFEIPVEEFSGSKVIVEFETGVGGRVSADIMKSLGK